MQWENKNDDSVSDQPNVYLVTPCTLFSLYGIFYWPSIPASYQNYLSQILAAFGIPYHMTTKHWGRFFSYQDFIYGPHWKTLIPPTQMSEESLFTKSKTGLQLKMIAWLTNTVQGHCMTDQHIVVRSCRRWSRVDRSRKSCRVCWHSCVNTT